MVHGQRRRCQDRRGSRPLPGARRGSGVGAMYQNRGTADRKGERGLGASDSPGRKGLGSAPGAPKLRAPRLSTPLPCHPTASRPDRPSVPALGEEPRRQQEPRTSGPGPAARGSAVLTFLPPRKSLRRVPLRPLQSPSSPAPAMAPSTCQPQKLISRPWESPL